MQKKNFSNPKMNARHYAPAPDCLLCFIPALKVCEGVLDIAYNIYTSGLSPKGLALKWAPWGSWGGKERYHNDPPGCVCPFRLYANYSPTDRERSLTGHNCLADAIHKCFSPAWRQWTKPDGPSVWQLGWSGARQGYIGAAAARGLILHSSA